MEGLKSVQELKEKIYAEIMAEIAELNETKKDKDNLITFVYRIKQIAEQLNEQKEEGKIDRSTAEIIESTCENICDNFCKYRETCDENNECEWVRQGNECPLDKLF